MFGIQPIMGGCGAEEDCLAFMAEGYFRNEIWFSEATCHLVNANEGADLRLLRSIRKDKDHLVVQTAAVYFGEEACDSARLAIRAVERFQLQRFF